MKEPLWVSAEVVLAVQEELLARFGGIAGLRDEGLLDYAINRPQHLFHYGKPSLFELAAEYAFGIVKNHPFLDGNKRAGFMTAYIFWERMDRS
ncbi:MAG: type II toxin-antitoxin system death-on-curing family toxin [Kiritimatiellales bacterium]|nr:type II toxin-antitoxin system death-on-curing family toxin [Kiritimatiellales bacterium]